MLILINTKKMAAKITHVLHKVTFREDFWSRAVVTAGVFTPHGLLPTVGTGRDLLPYPGTAGASWTDLKSVYLINQVKGVIAYLSDSLYLNVI